MLFVAEYTADKNMGHTFSKLEIESQDDSSTEETGGSPWFDRKLDFSDHDIAQLTKLQSVD